MTIRKGIVIIFVLCSFFLPVGISGYVYLLGSKYVSSLSSSVSAPVIIIPGAGLRADGTPSDILRDRLIVALAVYDDGRAEKMLCSGDNGQVEYDEVNAMRVWLLDHGVDPEDIVLDHAGFDTYDTMVRANKIFGVTQAIVVTQDFHLPRALYLAHAQGISVQGVSASLEPYVGDRMYRVREIFARIKAFFNVLFHVSPQYLGEEVDVMGDGRITWDEGL